MLEQNKYIWRPRSVARTSNRSSTASGLPFSRLLSTFSDERRGQKHMKTDLQTFPGSLGTAPSQHFDEKAGFLSGFFRENTGMHVSHGDFCPPPQTGSAIDAPPPRRDVGELSSCIATADVVFALAVSRCVHLFNGVTCLTPMHFWNQEGCSF